jgi:hypothetical protein
MVNPCLATNGYKARATMVNSCLAANDYKARVARQEVTIVVLAL